MQVSSHMKEQDMKGYGGSVVENGQVKEWSSCLGHYDRSLWLTAPHNRQYITMCPMGNLSFFFLLVVFATMAFSSSSSLCLIILVNVSQ